MFINESKKSVFKKHILLPLALAIIFLICRHFLLHHCHTRLHIIRHDCHKRRHYIRHDCHKRRHRTYLQYQY